ncbi:MAG: LytTR family DNA-binding domain-containing protein [Bacteroidia bacterium]
MMKHLRILIIEDEEAAAGRLEKLVQQIEPESIILAKLESIEESVKWLKEEEKPDLILMDIHLADGSSFQIFEQMEVKSPVIFITAYDEYAVRAFRLNSIDYLMKPVKKPELQQALERFKKLHEGEKAQLNYHELAKEIRKQEQQVQKRFLVKIGQSLRAVEPEQIAFCYTEEKITFFCTFDGHRYPVDYSLDKLEELLDPHLFFRINRQFIINMKAIDSMYAYSKGRVKVTLKPPAPEQTVVSVERSPKFKNWLEGE